MIHHLFTIAAFETRTILRDWLFRIFALLSLSLLTFMNIGFYSTLTNSPYLARSLAGAVAAGNGLIVNIAQSAIAVFLATDVLKRDRKLDTAEVVYVRPFDNATYLAGKALGILAAILGYDLLMQLITGTLHLLFTDIPFSFFPYPGTLALMILPTQICIIGLSFLAMRVFRNQAVAVVMVIGLLAGSYFYGAERLHHLPDLLGSQLGFLPSDFTGYMGLERLLVQRSVVALLGIAALGGAVLLMPRLPQSRVSRMASAAMVLIAVTVAGVAATTYLADYGDGSRLRAEMRELNARYRDYHAPRLAAADLSIDHEGTVVTGRAHLTLAFPPGTPRDSLILSLNPGLRVDSLAIAGRPVAGRRAHHLLVAPLPEALGDTITATVRYRGDIETEAMYTDIPDTTRWRPYWFWTYKIPKQYAIVDPDYLLLSPEALWYPVAGLPVGSVFPATYERDFTRFSLEARTDPALTLLSQGVADTLGAGHLRFVPEHPLSALSLLAGRYERHAVTVDSVTYALYHLPGHNVYSDYFPTIADTLAPLIREVRNDYESRLGLDLPQRRLSLVEVPIHFFHYPRVWTVADERQPAEQVWLPELAALVEGADFRRLKQGLERRFDHNNQTASDRESEILIFRRFVYFALSGQPPFRFGVSDQISGYQPDFNLFPQYFSHAHFVHSRRWPLFHSALEGYLYRRSNVPTRSEWEDGLSREEKASQELQGRSLADLLAADEPPQLVSDALRLRGDYLFKLIDRRAGDGDFISVVRELTDGFPFARIPVDTVLERIEAAGVHGMDSLMTRWYADTGLPGFRIDAPRLYRITDRSRVRYQVLVTVTNRETSPGIMEVRFRQGRRFGGGRGGRDDDDDPRTVLHIPADSTVEIGMLLDQEPRAMSLNTIISRNLPLEYTLRFGAAVERRAMEAFDGVRPAPPAARRDSTRVIVDNLDPGFAMTTRPHESWLKRVIQSERDPEDMIYKPFQTWRPPRQWALSKNGAFYGDYVQSAYFIRPGAGDQPVSWTAELPEAGTYDVYAYVFQKETLLRPWERDKNWGLYTFHVEHDDGAAEAEVDLDRGISGWQYLGSYYFSAGEARVTLSDQSKSPVVVADAVKFVKP